MQVEGNERATDTEEVTLAAQTVLQHVFEECQQVLLHGCCFDEPFNSMAPHTLWMLARIQDHLCQIAEI